MTPLKLDFVSDVVCPWCAIGLNALERALERIGPEIEVALTVQPFELNPAMGAAGEDIVEHLSAKYGIDAAQIARNQAALRERGEAVGFHFGPRDRIWNTFDAHRLLAWAGAEGAPGAQRALKHSLLRAYHGEGRNPAAHEVLLDLVRDVGLDPERARAVLAADEFGAEVRAAEVRWQRAGIHAVPALVINDRHLISGGQPVEVYERALRELARGDHG